MFTRIHPTKLTATAAAVLALTLGLTACGDDEPTAEPNAVRTADNGDVFNDADVAFATDMIPHHAQAIEMVTLTLGRTLDPEVQALADAIRATQAPEVEMMVDWLAAWDAEVPETSLDHSNAGHDMDDMGHGGSDSDMPGMMSGDQMDALANASDEEFEDLWLEMMIEHHAGAIEMARAEQDNGVFADAIGLAGAIVTSQQAEIDQMEALLGS